MCCKLKVMVLVEGLSRESVDNGSKVRKYYDEVMVVSSGSNSSGPDPSTSLDESSTKRESSNFLMFLNLLQKRMNDNIEAPTPIAAIWLGTSTEVGLRHKKRPVLKEKLCLLLSRFFGYTWVDGEVSIYFSRYTHKSDLLNRLSWLLITTIMELKYYLITLRTEMASPYHP